MTTCPRCHGDLEVCVDRHTGEILRSTKRVIIALLGLSDPVSWTTMWKRAPTIRAERADFWRRYPPRDIFEAERRAFTKLQVSHAPEYNGHCRACVASFRRASGPVSLEKPPGASLRGGPSAACFDPVRTVANEIETFPDGVTFPELKRHLGTMFRASTIRDKYLRSYLERGIKSGSIAASIDADGTFRYRRVSKLAVAG